MNAMIKDDFCDKENPNGMNTRMVKKYWFEEGCPHIENIRLLLDKGGSLGIQLLKGMFSRKGNWVDELQKYHMHKAVLLARRLYPDMYFKFDDRDGFTIVVPSVIVLAIPEFGMNMRSASLAKHLIKLIADSLITDKDLIDDDVREIEDLEEIDRYQMNRKHQ